MIRNATDPMAMKGPFLDPQPDILEVTPAMAVVIALANPRYLGCAKAFKSKCPLTWLFTQAAERPKATLVNDNSQRLGSGHKLTVARALLQVDIRFSGIAMLSSAVAAKDAVANKAKDGNKKYNHRDHGIRTCITANWNFTPHSATMIHTAKLEESCEVA